MALVSASWLLSKLDDPNVLVIDTRFTLGNPQAGLRAYHLGHIPGANFLDLERDLSAPVHPNRVGGRHPLPAVELLAATLSQIGISNRHHVIAYDDPSTGAAFCATHLWWMLRYLGHDAISVLDGGLPAWLAAGGSLTTEIPTRVPATFIAKPRAEMLVDANYVQNRAQNTLLIDSRAPERFRGDVEPLDWKAGHIPGAINLNWASAMEQGHWKSPEAQQSRISDPIKGNAEIVFYCGSGISATANLFALELAGVKGAKLYAGSWSDWISDPLHDIATGEPKS